MKTFRDFAEVKETSLDTKKAEIVGKIMEKLSTTYTPLSGPYKTVKEALSKKLSLAELGALRVMLL